MVQPSEPKRIILLGLKSSGKSSVGNGLIQETVFREYAPNEIHEDEGYGHNIKKRNVHGI